MHSNHVRAPGLPAGFGSEMVTRTSSGAGLSKTDGATGRRGVQRLPRKCVPVGHLGFAPLPKPSPYFWRGSTTVPKSADDERNALPASNIMSPCQGFRVTIEKSHELLELRSFTKRWSR